MTLQEAYIKAKLSNKAYESAYLTECRDYGNFWVFSFSPIPYDPKDMGTWVVGGEVKVDKKTESVRSIGAPAILGLKGKSVSLEQLNGLIRPVAQTKKELNMMSRRTVASQAVPA